MIESLLKACLFTKTSVAAAAAVDDITGGIPSSTLDHRLRDSLTAFVSSRFLGK